MGMGIQILKTWSYLVSLLQLGKLTVGPAGPLADDATGCVFDSPETMWRVNILLLQKAGSAHGWEGRKVVKVRCAMAAVTESNSLEYLGSGGNGTSAKNRKLHFR